jgi:hypothetical protein
MPPGPSTTLERATKIAVYAPPTADPWDDAVRLVLDYAGIKYDMVWDKEVMQGELSRYDWLHLHHEDFTGQYGKFYASYRGEPWYQKDVAINTKTAAELGFKKVSKMDLAVVELVRKYMADGGMLFDFRPVFRNRSAMAYAIACCVHTLEMNALRGWAVAFLAYVAGSTGAAGTALSPTLVATGFALLGVAASVSGNEVAIRVGRRKLIHAAMAGSIVIAAALAFAGTSSYAVAVTLLAVYGAVVWLDSSSLTAGAAGTAESSRRGATLAVHSMLGYAGGFVGPLAVGWVLDLFGGMVPAAWAAAFLMIACLMTLALAAFWRMRPRELASDRGASPSS